MFLCIGYNYYSVQCSMIPCSYCAIPGTLHSLEQSIHSRRSVCAKSKKCIILPHAINYALPDKQVLIEHPSHLARPPKSKKSKQ